MSSLERYQPNLDWTVGPRFPLTETFSMITGSDDWNTRDWFVLLSIIPFRLRSDVSIKLYKYHNEFWQNPHKLLLNIPGFSVWGCSMLMVKLFKSYDSPLNHSNQQSSFIINEIHIFGYYSLACLSSANAWSSLKIRQN